MEFDENNTTMNNLKDQISATLEMLDLKISPSHDANHTQRVLDFAYNLQQIHGGDIEIITAACLLHDLGRSNSQQHGETSRKASVSIARLVLQRMHFPKDKIDRVLQCILEHDQPEREPQTTEAKILKDSDFLDGFGATGIIRIALWTGESQGTYEDIQRRLQKMRQRIKGLCYPESKQYAIEQYVSIAPLISQLETQHPEIQQIKGRYIVIEGISGAGKSTQTQRLITYLQSQGQNVSFFQEPSVEYKTMQSVFQGKRDPTSRMLTFFIDRAVNLIPTLNEQLQQGNTIVSDRSFLSTMVYQSNGSKLSPEEIAYVHKVIGQPLPTHIIILDIDPQTAYTRIIDRSNKNRRKLGENETPEKLASARQAFLDIERIFPNINVINVNGKNEDQICNEIQKIVNS